EALQCGTPVVSTSLGAKGLGLVDGRDLLLADTPEEFVSQAKRLLASDEMRRAMVRRAQEQVLATFSPSAVAARRSEILRSVIASRRLKRACMEDCRPGPEIIPPLDKRTLPRVCAVVLNYCCAKETIACVGALQKTNYKPLSLVVVDNCSPDNSVETLKS